MSAYIEDWGWYTDGGKSNQLQHEAACMCVVMLHTELEYVPLESFRCGTLLQSTSQVFWRKSRKLYEFV
jgi:hypothetical protein